MSRLSEQRAEASTDPPVTVLRDRNVPSPESEHAQENGLEPDAVFAVPLSEALTREWPSDAHLQAYAPAMLGDNNGEPFPVRLARGCIDEGIHPVMIALIGDIDGPDHQHTEAWDAATEAALSATGLAWYRTRGGYRVLAQLAEPFTITSQAREAEWSARYLAWCDAAHTQWGLEFDRKCKDWTRLQRLPNVTRDGREERAELRGLVGCALPRVSLPAQKAPAKRAAAPPTAEPGGDAADRAIAIAQQMPPSIEGQGGDEALMQCAREIAKVLNDTETVDAIMTAVFNPRCLPPWPAAKLTREAARAVEHVTRENARLSGVRNALGRNREPAAEPEPSTDAGMSEDQIRAGAELPRTDLGNARRLTLYFGADLRYCTQRKKWLVWDDSRWAWDERDLALNATMQIPDLIWREQKFSTDPSAHAKHALQSQNRQRIEASLALARAELAVAVRDLDSDPWVLNTENGALDLRKGELREPSRDDLITKRANATFVAGARSELWDSFIATLTGGDSELAAYVQRSLGCALIGEHREKAFWVGYGPPDGGKSTFINAVARVLGDYHVSADAETWLTRSNMAGSNRGDLVRLLGTRLVTTSEFKRGVRFDPKVIKQITGGDPIVAAAKYENEIEFIPTFCLWFVANDAPAIDSDEAGMWARARRVPCVNSIPKEQQDKTLARKLSKPSVRAAILAWLVEGVDAYLRDGLGTCAAVEQSTVAWRNENDRFAEFLDNQCEFGTDAKHWVSTQALTEHYQNWTKRNKAREMSEREIGKILSADARVSPKTRKVAGGNKRGWIGIAFVG